ncbi:hypothetical protein CH372_19685 [Leptospira meyeri]|uniref:DUF4393 domain-containing protein n=1 Tax=Leptospira meyeri TaxID=29508 RepID=UPI000C29DB14|nr:DUF4393 domain-containing protein [Leptospira meyeri]PKA10383.1 hypothetical protein CH372_19685 [Leptospira meyeri]
MSLSDLAKAPKALIEFTREIYGDLAKPGLQKVGHAFSILMGFLPAALWKFEVWQDQKKLLRDKYFEEYRLELENIPIEKIVPVLPDLGVPIIQNLSHTITEEVGRLYINLLTKASNLDTFSDCHPKMISTIQSLSPDEAKIIGYLNSLGPEPYGLPSIKLSYGTKQNAVEVFSKYFCFEEKVNLSNPASLFIYIDNLVQLEILEHRRELVDDQNGYNYLSNTNYVKNIKEEYLLKHKPTEGKDFLYYQGILLVTKYGRLFIKTCGDSITSN